MPSTPEHPTATTAPIDPASLPSPVSASSSDPVPPVATSSSAADEVKLYPLQSVDPPKIGDFWPTARLVATASGVAYLAHEDHSSTDVMVILLSQGASQDMAARDRLAGEVDHMDIDTVIARGGLEQDGGRLADKYRGTTDAPLSGDEVVQSPWVALAFDNSPRAIDEARRILDQIDLNRLPQQGLPDGPDYRLHWSDQVGPGLTKVWPLPWPGKYQRGGRLSVMVAWLLMILLAAMAILIAILIFSQAPQTTPPPPIPQTQTASGGGSGGTPPPSASDSSSASASPPESPSSGSASPSESPSSASASPSQSPSSASPSPSPSSSGGPSGATPTPSAGGSPTPISRL